MLIQLGLPNPRNQNTQSHAYSELCCQEEGTNNTPQDLELVIKVAFVDSEGNPGHAVTRTSRLPPCNKNAHQQLRLALGTFYAMLGCHVSAAQISMDVAKSILGVRPRPRLRLVKG